MATKKAVEKNNQATIPIREHIRNRNAIRQERYKSELELSTLLEKKNASAIRQFYQSKQKRFKKLSKQSQQWVPYGLRDHDSLWEWYNAIWMMRQFQPWVNYEVHVKDIVEESTYESLADPGFRDGDVEEAELGNKSASARASAGLTASGDVSDAFIGCGYWSTITVPAASAERNVRLVSRLGAHFERAEALSTTSITARVWAFAHMDLGLPVLGPQYVATSEQTILELVAPQGHAVDQGGLTTGGNLTIEVTLPPADHAQSFRAFEEIVLVANAGSENAAHIEGTFSWAPLLFEVTAGMVDASKFNFLP